ncbi:hypothetical protein T08_6372 [Trichinella sp. T8]|nr:hypothetical protein T08_6372 [Trichinella sp. T8]
MLTTSDGGSRFYFLSIAVVKSSVSAYVYNESVSLLTSNEMQSRDLNEPRAQNLTKTAMC